MCAEQYVRRTFPELCQTGIEIWRPGAFTEVSLTQSFNAFGRYVAKQEPSAAYRVQLPKGMDYPTLTPKQQIVADRMRESLKQDSGKSDLDLLKEELRIIIEKLG